MAKKKFIPGRKVSSIEKFFFFIGAFIILIFSVFLSACFYSETGNANKLPEFIDNLQYFARNVGEIFTKKYIFSQSFLICALSLEFAYLCILLIYLLRPNKFVRGKEYGDAEWEDVSFVNEKLQSQFPEEKYKVYFNKEKFYKKVFRKLGERKKRYIK